MLSALKVRKRFYISPISPLQEAANEMELAQRARMDEMRERQRRRQERP